MSATLGDVDFFRRDLTARTGRPTTVVTSAQRPVPLHFEYRTTTLHRSVEELLTTGRAPVYLVYFTQRDATDAAQHHLSLDPLSTAEKTAIKDALRGFRFDSPIGRDLRRYIAGGIGVHHAGLLPKYRLLVEKLAQDGLLKIICGTDTLGVGINVPIRSVLFTQLCKYDGASVRVLSNREFAQIAGRAGRKGFDEEGDVWVQAPAHVVENLRLEEKAAATGKRKVVKRKPPERGYAHWTEQTFEKLVTGRPEALRSHFQVNHQMLMNVLDRPVIDGVDGCAAVRRLMVANHETRARQRQHVRRAIAIYRSLVAADLLEFPDEPDDLGRRVRVNFDLQDEFALHQPLSLWAVEAIGQLPARPAGEELLGALDVLTLIEAVQESPAVVVAAQLQAARDALMAEMKASGVEYEERMERLSQVEPPRPNRDWIYASFDEFRAQHPWVGGDNVRPKSIAREMFERVMTFTEYVNHYRLKRAEGVLLRYLSDVYKGLVQNIPEDDRTEAIDDVTAWLGAVVRQVDSSLIDEWERLLDPPADLGELRPPAATETSVVDDARAFRVMVRNQVFDWVQRLAARRGYDALGDPDDVERAMDPYWQEFDELLLDADARGPDRFRYDPGAMTVTQILHDPLDTNEWRITARVDVDASREQGRAVLELVGVGR
jgi:superfamily II RNA helicase